MSSKTITTLLQQFLELVHVVQKYTCTQKGLYTVYFNITWQIFTS